MTPVPTVPEINFADVQPAMRGVVAWLRQLGFDTTDSGDGVTNVAMGMEGALDIPHVFMLCASEVAFAEADRLWAEVNRKGLTGATVQMSYSPEDRECVLSLFGIDDSQFSGAMHP